MNVTSTLGEWIADSSHNHGLYISVRSVNRPEHEIRLEELGLVTRETGLEDDDQMQPVPSGLLQGPGSDTTDKEPTGSASSQEQDKEERSQWWRQEEEGRREPTLASVL